MPLLLDRHPGHSHGQGIHVVQLLAGIWKRNMHQFKQDSGIQKKSKPLKKNILERSFARAEFKMIDKVNTHSDAIVTKILINDGL